VIFHILVAIQYHSNVLIALGSTPVLPSKFSTELS